MNGRLLKRVGGLTLTGIVLAGIVGGVMAQRNHPPLNAQSTNSTVDSQLIDANLQFGFKLFSEIVRQSDRNENIFVSPTSVAIALSMTYNGASGETQAAMAEVLAVQDMSLQAMNRANEVLKTSLVNADPQVQLTIANSLWAKQNYSFKSDFLQRNRQFYEAEIAELDFSRPDVTETINRWVAEKTNGKIEQIIEGIQPNQILFLINAIYFKGNWTQAFEQSQTTEQPFYLADGTSKQHPLMSQSGEYQYYETDTFEAISLPYGEGRFSFYVFLPREASNLNAFQQQLTAENWQEWMQQFQSRQGTIVLPRFQLEYAIQLNDALKALGMGVAFESRANFSEMVDGSAYIDAVQHKTFVEVNETGTEAAAATSVAIAESAEIGEEPFQMVVNRPFWCAIRDNQTGAILFMGSITEPQ